MPEFKDKRSWYDLLMGDLLRASLTNSGGLHAMMSASGMMQRETSDLGRRFLAFISREPRAAAT